MKMKMKPFLNMWVLLALFFSVNTAFAMQTDDIRLNVRRSFGFSSGAQIRGTFTLDVVGNVTIASVTYLIDGKPIAEITQSPFSYSFQTTSFSDGWHDLSAKVQTADQRTLQTPIRKYEFVSAEVEGQAVSNIIVPLLGVVAIIMVGGVLSQILIFRKKGLNNLPYGAERSFGIMGGTVCPKCKRVFSIHWWGINALAGKFDRCDYCGKWSIVRRKSDSDLQAAIQNERSLGKPETAILPKSTMEKSKEMVDDSKYTDL